MKSLTEREFKRKLNEIVSKNKQKEYRIRLRAEKNKYKTHIETNKLLAIYLFILFNIIIIYVLAMMYIFKDLSYLGVLITDIAAQVLVYGIYCLKAYKAKKQEEYMKFEREKFNGSFAEIAESIDESDSELQTNDFDEDL